MEPLKESLRPRPRPRIQTGKKTLRNRVVWADETSKDPYSELTVTVPWGEGYAVIPTVDANGNKLSTEEALEKTLEKKLSESKNIRQNLYNTFLDTGGFLYFIPSL